MVGNEMKPERESTPPVVVTATSPEPPEGTMTVIVVGDTTVYPVAAIPAKRTSVTPVKFVPVMVTLVPAVADMGVKEAMVGGGRNVNPLSDPLPLGVITLNAPDVPLPTTAVIVVSPATVNDAASVPPKLTDVAPLKLIPVMVTEVPAPAEVGMKPETITGG